MPPVSCDRHIVPLRDSVSSLVIDDLFWNWYILIFFNEFLLPIRWERRQPRRKRKTLDQESGYLHFSSAPWWLGKLEQHTWPESHPWNKGVSHQKGIFIPNFVILRSLNIPNLLSQCLLTHVFNIPSPPYPSHRWSRKQPVQQFLGEFASFILSSYWLSIKNSRENLVCLSPVPVTTGMWTNLSSQWRKFY